MIRYAFGVLFVLLAFSSYAYAAKAPVGAQSPSYFVAPLDHSRDVAQAIQGGGVPVGIGLPSPAVICNIKTGAAIGVGAGTCIAHPATCNGIADDSQAVIDFNNWATTTFQPTFGIQPISLFVPSGSNCIVNHTIACNVNSGNLDCPFINIGYMILSGYGATMLFNDAISLGGIGLFDGGSLRRSTRLASVSAGATCANLLTPSQGSIFTIGNYAYIGGFDMQGLYLPTGPSFGWPPNHYYFEWPIVSAVSTSLNCDGVTSGGSVSFTAPLINTYLASWPLYDPGSGANNIGDEGGPATLYVVDPSWKSTVDIRGVSMQAGGAGQLGINSRTVILTDVTLTGTACAIPSQNFSWTNTNVDASSCDIEVDKLIGSYNWNGGAVRQIKFQSSSINVANFSNLNITNSLQGAPKRFIGKNVTIASDFLGAIAFGRTNDWECDACTINSIASAFGAGEKGTLSGGTWSIPGQGGGPYSATMSGGVITIPLAHGAVGWAVPGTNIVFGGAQENDVIAQVTGVTQDATNTYVATTLTGGFPSIPLQGGTVLSLNVLGAPKFTCSNCGGNEPQIPSLTQAPAGAPIYSFQTYPYTGASGISPTGFHLWGDLVQMNMNVTNAYTGAGALTFAMTQFNNLPVILSNGTSSSYNQAGGGPKVNLKIVGNRQVTPSGVTGTQSGDAGLTTLDPLGMWFTTSSSPFFSADASSSCPGPGCPAITFTIQTDQHVVNPPN